MLEQARHKTKPQSVDLYEAFGPVLYLLCTGCQWRAVHSYFAKWSQPNQDGASLLERGSKIGLARPALNNHQLKLVGLD